MGGVRGGARTEKRRFLVWVLCTLLVTVGFGRLAWHNIANYRPLSNDEGELLAVAYKLATQGVLGSDMYAGFFRGDEHHLETLPLQPVLQAVSFRLLGTGVAQARAVSVLAAIGVVWLAGWLALRWYGLAAAVLAELLLVAWRSNLTAASDGMPLLGVARTARYDVLALAAAWLALGALEVTLRKPGRPGGLCVGIAAGIAALAQFFGSFTLPLVLLACSLNRRAKAMRLSPWILAGFGLIVAPYVAYAARFASDLVGQLSVYGPDRGAFVNVNFYASNIIAEPRRYAELVARWPPVLDVSGGALSDNPISPWLMVIGIGPALVYVAWRARRSQASGDRVLLSSFVCFGGFLALLDQTKVALYAILLLPTLCMLLSAAAVGLLTWTWRHTAGLWAARGLVVTVITIVCGCVGLESIHAYAVDWGKAASVTPYLPLGEQIDAAIAPGAPVLGPERWWWALHRHPYLSLRSIWFQWVTQSTPEHNPEFADWVWRAHAATIIVNVNVRDDIRAFPVALQDQFWTFVDRCADQIVDIPNPNYFETEVYSVREGCS